MKLLPLCECDCGQLVKKPHHRFLHLHHSRVPGMNRKRSRLMPMCKCDCGQLVREHFRRFLDQHQHRCHSEESNRSRSKTLMGHVVTQKTRDKIAAGNTGQVRPEYNEKMQWSPERRKKFSKSGNHKWLGEDHIRRYPSAFNRKLKNKILSRDNHQCQNPGCWKGIIKRIVVHHIDYDKNNCDPDNLITVCNSCNGRAGSGSEFWTAYYRKLMRTRDSHKVHRAEG